MTPFGTIFAHARLFEKPERYTHATYKNEDGRIIRYGYYQAKKEKAVALHLGGQTQFLEMDYENAISLGELGISTFFLERCGDGGSERLYDDPQKPPAIDHDIHIRDIVHFTRHYIEPSPHRPLILFGHCLGGLIALKLLQHQDNIFDHCILTSPLLGMLWNEVRGAEKEDEWSKKDIDPATRDSYINKARNWSCELAARLTANDTTTHDPVRGGLHHVWRAFNPALRLGGYTHGNMTQIQKSLAELYIPGVIDNIRTPVTIFSAPEDTINDPARHRYAASRLVNGAVVSIEGARHGLWREADQWRDQLLAGIGGIVHGHKGDPRRFDRPDQTMFLPVVDWFGFIP